jgi:hypothetical protein
MDGVGSPLVQTCERLYNESRCFSGGPDWSVAAVATPIIQNDIAVQPCGKSNVLDAERRTVSDLANTFERLERGKGVKDENDDCLFCAACGRRIDDAVLGSWYCRNLR